MGFSFKNALGNVNPGAVTLTAITGAGLIALKYLTGDRSADRRIFYPDTGGAPSGAQAPQGGWPIRTIIPHVTVREVHDDALSITHHPVEQGAAISDHAYKHPAQLVIEAGWSNARQASKYGADALLNTVTSMVPNAPSPNYLRDLYSQMLKLQADRQLVSIQTGKRTYASMLLERLRTITDEKTETVLLVSMEFKQVIIVRTQTVTIPPQGQHADPEKTAPTVNRGTVQPSQREAQIAATQARDVAGP
jgi:hypothetical protein